RCPRRRARPEPSARPSSRPRSEGPRNRPRRSSEGRPPADQVRATGRAHARPACHPAFPLLSASRLPWRLVPNLLSSSLPGRPRAASRRCCSPLLSKAAEHRLYGVQDGALPCSAADWAGTARHAIAEIHASGRTPILVGGTGLYLRTLLDGIAPVPAIDPVVRARVRETPIVENRAKLKSLDPQAAARLNERDSARINRALEVILSTGRTLAEWQERREGGIARDVELRPLILLPPRKWLYARCDERFVRMIDEGAVAEVETLLARKLNPNVPV